jgi:alpha-amylase
MIKNTFTSICLLILVFFSSNVFAQNQQALKSTSQDSVFWWNDDVFYEVFVRSFYDSNGDGIGDLQGLIDKLDYLKTLGVDALWLMPIMPSPSYHGYDVTNYLDVNPQYGTLNTFHQLMDSAHAKGMKIIIDYVMNHTSNDHPWFESSQSSTTSPYRDWYVWANAKPPYDQGIWYLDNGAYYYAYFCNCMPDLNYRDTSVQNEMLNISGFWIDSMHTDGFRLDAIQYLVEDGDTLTNTSGTHQFIAKFRKYYDVQNPQTFTVGEVGGPATPEIAGYVGDTQLNTCFEFNVASAILNSINGFSPVSLESEMSEVIKDYPYLQYCTFLTNHDQDRVFDQLGSNMAKMKLAAAVYLTLPGVPFLYYGEEVGMSGSGVDQNKRKPMQWNAAANSGFTTGTPWESLNTNYATYNVATEQADTNSLWNWYQKLIAVRHQEDALRRGTYQQLYVNNSEVYSFMRAYQNDSLLAIMNFSGANVPSLTLNVQSAGIAKGTYAVIDLLNGNKTSTLTVDAAGNISGVNINAQSVLLYKFDGIAGVTSPAASSSIRCYPNPATNEVMIQFPQNISSSLSLSIYDMQGKLISKPSFQKNNNYTIQLSIAELSSGVYTIRLTNNNETSNLKVIKL